VTVDERRFRDELRSQLVTAAAQDGSGRGRGARRVRRAGALVAAAAVIVALLVGLTVLGPRRPAAADVVITEDGNDFVVQLTDLTTTPQEVVDAARMVGLDIQVTEYPVGPSNVGRFLSMASTSDPALRPLEEGASTFDGFRIRKDWEGTLVLALGRKARPGEMWFARSDALAPGELLECEPVLGRRVDEIERGMRDSGIDVRWFMVPAPLEVSDPAPYGSWRIVNVESLAEDNVTFYASEDGEWPFLTPQPEMPDGC
jgi:hypothetical protein